jgi:hypothetical protein
LFYPARAAPAASDPARAARQRQAARQVLSQHGIAFDGLAWPIGLERRPSGDAAVPRRAPGGECRLAERVLATRTARSTPSSASTGARGESAVFERGESLGAGRGTTGRPRCARLHAKSGAAREEGGSLQQQQWLLRAAACAQMILRLKSRVIPHRTRFPLSCRHTHGAMSWAPCESLVGLWGLQAGASCPHGTCINIAVSSFARLRTPLAAALITVT